MGHHINEDGKFQSDMRPELPPDWVGMKLSSPKVERAGRQLALAYREGDREFSDDINDRLDALHGKNGPDGKPGGIRVLLDLRVTHVGEGVYEDMQIFLGDKDVTAVFDQRLFKLTRRKAHDCLAYVLADLFEHELGGGRHPKDPGWPEGNDQCGDPYPKE